MKGICEYLDQEELDKIKAEVGKAELLTSGEIKVVIRCACEKGLSTRKQAFRDFYAHGLEKTRDQTGILILVLLKERKVEVLGDRGINERVPAGYWDSVVRMVTDGFRQEKRCEGICKAVAEVGRLLQERFPRKLDDINELPDEVVQE